MTSASVARIRVTRSAAHSDFQSARMAVRADFICCGVARRSGTGSEPAAGIWQQRARQAGVILARITSGWTRCRERRPPTNEAQIDEHNNRAPIKTQFVVTQRHLKPVLPICCWRRAFRSSRQRRVGVFLERRDGSLPGLRC
jgi:hypothetical protein